MASSPLSNDVNSKKAKVRATILGLGYSIVINGVLPFVIYQLLKSYTSVSDLVALFASGIPPIVDAVIGVIRKGRVDLIAGIALISIAMSIVLIFLGGSPKLYLIRESLFTGAFGVAYLISLLFPRPLAFYFARQFVTGNHSMNVEGFNSLWQYQAFRFSMRLTTVVWGVGFVLEAMIRIFLVFTLTVSQFLIVSPFVFYSFFCGIMLWTFIYSRRSQKRGEGRRKQQLAEQTSAEMPAK